MAGQQSGRQPVKLLFEPALELAGLLAEHLGFGLQAALEAFPAGGRTRLGIPPCVEQGPTRETFFDFCVCHCVFWFGLFLFYPLFEQILCSIIKHNRDGVNSKNVSFTK
jgi:hypothetical protein